MQLVRMIQKSFQILAMAVASLLILLLCSFVARTSAHNVAALPGMLRGTPWSLNNEGVDPSSLKSALHSRGLSAIQDLDEELQVLDVSGNTIWTSVFLKQRSYLHRLTHLDSSNSPHLDAQPLRSLKKQAEPLYLSRRHLLHHRSLLQSSSSSSGTRRPLYYTYIAGGCLGAIIFVILTFCCCRYMSTRKTRNDVFLHMPSTPCEIPFQPKPSRSIYVANRNLEVDDVGH